MVSKVKDFAQLGHRHSDGNVGRYEARMVTLLKPPGFVNEKFPNSDSDWVEITSYGSFFHGGKIQGLASTTTERRWVHNFLKELSGAPVKTLVIYCDNLGAT
uniref:Uncharacterized protein n=1 Tax=Solanum lycopersicum TaxID=4081 RepID=A0A3Q7J766_SOLLC